VDDPIDMLSSTTKAFLNSIGITTAAEFLTARTTDISAEFVKWRAAEGRPKLRGLGAIASVSGWKSSVRGKAIELGLYVSFVWTRERFFPTFSLISYQLSSCDHRDELAEIDPKHKSVFNAKAVTTKTALRRPSSDAHPQSLTTAKRARRSKQDDGERNTDGKEDGKSQASRGARAAEITLPPGASLVEDGKELFAVQHRGAPLSPLSWTFIKKLTPLLIILCHQN
jgi:hypothetical protein